MARTATITTTPAVVIEASQTRNGIEIINNGTVEVYVRHGGTLDVTSDAACGVPLQPQGSRSLAGDQARLAVSAAVKAGDAATVLYFHEYFAS